AFLIFFPVVTTIYFLLPHKWRWVHLLVSSCVFYMFFIPIYIFILIFTIVIDYFAGILIDKAQVTRRTLFLLMSIVANVGLLCVFKYYNFFVMNTLWIANLFGAHLDLQFVSIILPIGLSFHT